MTLPGANQIQLVDRLVAPEQTEEEAIEEAARLADLPAPAFAIMKRNRIELIRLRYEKNNEQKSLEFLDCWFSDSTQELLRKASLTF